MNILNTTITSRDFEKQLKINSLEAFNEFQVESWTKDVKSLIEKSQTEDLDDLEKGLLEEFQVCAPNLVPISVIGDDLSKSVMYVRKSQVIWDKNEDGDLMKSKSGIYSDTPENRKLGRVGQKFGSKKEE